MKRDNEQHKRDFRERRAASTAGRIYWQMQAESLLYDYEAQLKKTLEVLRAADIYINSVDMESYETETGYWLVPITIEILKE